MNAPEPATLTGEHLPANLPRSEIVLRTSGVQEPLAAFPTLAAIRELIGAQTLDTFRTRDGRTVYVDDNGHERDLPLNPAATKIYRAICRPGTTHEIRGDVVIVSGGR